MKTEDSFVEDEMPDEIDFSGGVRGKYAAAYRTGTNVVLLDADVMEQFPDSESVNAALRKLMQNTSTDGKAGVHAKAS